MSLDRTTRKVIYQGDGKAVSFLFAFKVFEPSDIAVEVGVPNETNKSLACGPVLQNKKSPGRRGEKAFAFRGWLSLRLAG